MPVKVLYCFASEEGDITADGFCIKPVVEGFLDACRDQPLEGLGLPLIPGDFLALLRAFGKRELEDLFQPLLALYRQEGRPGLAPYRGQCGRSCKRTLEGYPKVSRISSSRDEQIALGTEIR